MLKTIHVTHAPRDGVCIEEVCEHSSHVAEFVGLQPVNGFVLLLEDGLKTLHVVLLQQAEALQRFTKGEINIRHRQQEIK